MKRLTERNPSWIDDELWESACEPDCEEIDAVYRKLKEYEDLEEQGRLIKLPCKVGDTVYAIGFNNNKPIIYESVVLSILITEKEIAFNVKVDEFGINSKLKQSMFDKTVFLTKSEAEAKLKELRGGGVAPKMDTKVANKENVISFLKKRFPNKIQMFNTRNFVGDHMITIYDSNGVVIDYCPGYEYIEIFGLTDDEFAIAVKECGYN